MARNFTISAGAVAEVEEAIVDVFSGRRWTFENMIRLRFDAEKCNFLEITVWIIFSEVSEVSLFSFIGMPCNSKWNSLKRSSCMIAALRFSVARSCSSVSRLTSTLCSFFIFLGETSKLVSTTVIRKFRLDSICARRRWTDWRN